MIRGGASPTTAPCTMESRPGIFRPGSPIERHAMLAPRSFPRPWSVIEIPGGFRVDDANGKRLGYFCSWDDANAVHPPDDVLTADEARRVAEEFAKLPEP
jgi:hypothetical protein